MSQIKSVLLWENPRRYIREAIDEGTLRGAIIPTGSTEQHNEASGNDSRYLQAQCMSQSWLHRSLFPEVVVTDAAGNWRVRALDGS